MKGESQQSEIRFQYTSAVPSGLSSPELIEGTRTESTVGIQMFEPSSSTTDVLGYRLFANESDSNAVPTLVVYDGEAVPNILQTTLGNL